MGILKVLRNIKERITGEKEEHGIGRVMDHAAGEIKIHDDEVKILEKSLNFNKKIIKLLKIKSSTRKFRVKKKLDKRIHKLENIKLIRLEEM